MKQFLLFAGQDDGSARGVQALVGDFDSFAEAFVSLVDRQTPSQWWHVLDTKTGEVVERQHLKVSNNMVGFQRSDWTVGQSPQQAASTSVIPQTSPSLPKATNLVRLGPGSTIPSTPEVKGAP
ncbi:MAG TPA: hypothetical protein VFG99_06935, partial [Chloroflexia bacterium]|nr:hypothetical protein [Chloroflexia bacterium]